MAVSPTFTILIYLLTKPQIDWNEVAKLANFKTSKYARDSWTAVRNKLVATSMTKNSAEDADEENEAPKPSGKKKATPRKRENGRWACSLRMVCRN